MLQRFELTTKKYDDGCANPGRGWYSIFPFIIPESFNPEELKWCLKKDEGLVLLRLCIKDFKDRELTVEALENIRGILGFFRSYEKDIILRFVYDDEGKGMENEPLTRAIIFRHMEQLAEVIVDFRDSIYTIQGLLVGSWGEMHSSKFLDDESLVELYVTFCRRLWEKARGAEAAGKEQASGLLIPMAVRRPAQRRVITSNIRWAVKTGKRIAGALLDKELAQAMIQTLGLFNDGLTASETDFGTYEDGKREEEIEYQRDVCLDVRNGGEAVGLSEYNEGDRPLEYFRNIHISYLNSCYDEAVLKRLQENGVKTVLDEKLGYEIVLDNYEVVKEGSRELALRLGLKNTGYGSLYEAFRVCVMEIDDSYTETVADGKESRTITGSALGLYQGEYTSIKGIRAGESVEIAVPLALEDAEGKAVERSGGLSGLKDRLGRKVHKLQVSLLLVRNGREIKFKVLV